MNKSKEQITHIVDTTNPEWILDERESPYLSDHKIIPDNSIIFEKNSRKLFLNFPGIFFRKILPVHDTHRDPSG
jgi:hypothetical protein